MNNLNILKKNKIKESLIFLDKMGFIYGSNFINYENGKKKSRFIKNWKYQTESFYEEKCNSTYVLTGQLSNCFVIDIDDINKIQSKTIFDFSINSCNLICKTNKGYHFYYKFDKDICDSKTFQQYGFDIRSNKGIIYCPPTYYFINDRLIEYNFIKKPHNYVLNEIDAYLKSYLLNLIFVKNYDHYFIENFGMKYATINQNFIYLILIIFLIIVIIIYK